MELLKRKCTQVDHKIDFINLCSGDEVAYSVVVIEGCININENCDAEKYVIVEQIDGSWSTPPITNYCMVNNCFKCILKLNHGNNKFVFRYCSCEKDLVIKFKPQETSLFVLPVYVICRGHDGRFQAPDLEDNSIESACDRIVTGMRLVQCLFAELLNNVGYGRRTFSLKSDVDPEAPECNVFYSTISVEEAHDAKPEDLWSWLGRELMLSHLGNSNHKFVAFLSSTWYHGEIFKGLPSSNKNVKKCTGGHVALGGGGLALLHTGCLHTWAQSVEEVVPRLICATSVDTAQFMDDSNNKGTYGACFSTALGAVAHELGHTFNLGHTSHGIMGTGYHNIHLMFLPRGYYNKPTLPIVDHANAKLKEPNLQEEKRDWSLTTTTMDLLQENKGHPPGDQEQKSTSLVREIKVEWKPPEPTKSMQAKKALLESIHQYDLVQSAIINTGEEAVAERPAGLISNNLKFFEGVSHSESGNQHKRSSRWSCQRQSAQVVIESSTEVSQYLQPMYDALDVSDFFAQSSLHFLGSNRWMNPLASVDTPSSRINYDKERQLISSHHDLSVVEIRDISSKSLLHWSFFKRPGITEFLVPQNAIPLEAHFICVSDTAGNILKMELSTRPSE